MPAPLWQRPDAKGPQDNEEAAPWFPPVAGSFLLPAQLRRAWDSCQSLSSETSVPVMQRRWLRYL